VVGGSVEDALHEGERVLLCWGMWVFVEMEMRAGAELSGETELKRSGSSEG
jgi:hypothetical protein